MCKVRKFTPQYVTKDTLYMKRLLLLLPMLLGAGSPNCAQAQQTSTYKHKALIYDVADGEAAVYGYLRYDTKYRTNGLTTFRTNTPSTYSLIKDYGNIPGKTPIFTAGTYVGKDYLAYETTLYANVLMPYAFSVIDPSTGACERKSVFPEGAPILILDEMTYDPKTDRIFGVHYDTDRFTTDLYEVNRTTYAINKVAVINDALFTLSAENGYLYAIISDEAFTKSTLVRIDEKSIDAGKQTCTMVNISPAEGTGISIGNYSQSMEFDKTTHRLWWTAQAADGKAYLIELNPETGKAITQTQIDGDLQLLSMAIPYQYVAEEAPSYVRNLTVKAGEFGASNATLTWTTPNTDYSNKSLASIDGIRIYRNDQLVQTVSTTEKGKSMDWTDTGLAEGNYIYKVVPYNQKGDGIYKEASAFVGEDVPGAPVNVQLTTNDTKGTITWSEPAMGANKGYYDKATLTYDVVRMPDNVTIATKTTARSVEDQVTVHAGYSYVVTAYSKKGKGLSATSNTVAYGSSGSIPFISDLKTKDEVDRWTVLDNNNDGMTWKFDPTTSSAFYDRSEKNADDWLVSPPLSFNKEKKYQLRYTYSTANWVNPDDHKPVMEKMKVFYGTTPTAAGLTTMIVDLKEFHTASETYYYGKNTFSVDASGNGHVAFQACSDAMHGRIYLKDVSLREYSEKDLSLKDLSGSATANCGVEQVFVATISNEGSKAVSNYTVQLINADTNEELASAAGVSVAPDATGTVSIKWIPATEGDINVSARVILEGDTYPKDNTFASSIKVKVAAKDASKWLTLNTDESYGWYSPFFVSMPYSQAQCLYMEDEIQKKDISFVAMQVKYNGKAKNEFTFPARIYMKKTDRTNLISDDNEYIGVFEEGDWTKVFDGNITISGQKEGEDLQIKFDTPFHYTGGNLNMKFEALAGGKRLMPNQHPEWHLKEIVGKPRTAHYDGQTSNIKESEIFPSPYVPFMMLEYKDGNTSGMLSVGGEGLNIYQNGNVLYLSSVCDKVDLFSTSGALVGTANHTDRLQLTSLSSGVYILKVNKKGHIQTLKIVLKR